MSDQGPKNGAIPPIPPGADAGHLSAEDLAALADGRVSQEARDRAERHLSGCLSCFEALDELLQVRLALQATPGEFAADRSWVREALAIPPAPSPAAVTGSPAGRAASEPRRRAPIRGRSPALSRPTVALAAVGATVAVAVLGGLRLRDELLWRTTLAPVREILAESATPLWYPRVERAPLPSGPTYRSGGQPADPRLEGSLRRLSRRYERDPASRDVAYWLVAGLVENGQLSLARTTLDAARRRAPGDADLAVLDAIISYREDRMEAAAESLRAVLARHPEHPQAGHNLGILERDLRPTR